MRSSSGKESANPGRRIVARFFSMIELGDLPSAQGKMHNACWIWTGGATGKGYPAISISLRSVYAHHLSFRIFRTLVAHVGRFEIHHRCGNKRCVNPEHLVLLSRSRHALLHGCGRGPRNKDGTWRCGAVRPRTVVSPR